MLKRRAKANLSGQEKIGLEAWEFWGKRDAEALRQSNLLRERGSYGRDIQLMAMRKGTAKV